MFRRFVLKTLWRLGYEIRRLHGPGWGPDNLRKPGLDPKTIVDVGVADGTVGLPEAFPSAHFVWVEPLQEYEGDLRRLVAQHGGEYVLSAAGDHDGTVTIHIDRKLMILSSINGPNDVMGSDSMETREVPIVRLDTLVEERGLHGPFGLKIDVEGFEYEVASGATHMLEDTQFVIAELSPWRNRPNGENEFTAFVRLMDEHGFFLADVLNSAKSHDLEIIVMDVMFRPKS